MKIEPNSSTADAADPKAAFRNRVRKAVIWRSGTQIAGQIISWLSTFLVIRLLSPSDYGLVAMTGVLMLFLSLVNGYGFASALIQRDAIESRHLRQLFGITILLNAALAAIQIVAAPYAAAYYREPMVADLLYAQALLYPTTPFIVLAYAILSREMEFKRQAQVNIVATILGALTAVGGALAGWGVWTLVWAPLVIVYARAIGLTIAARALMWPSFDLRGAGFIARFGGFVLIGQLFWFVQSQADVFIVGRAYDAYALGIYTTALFLTQIFVTKVVPPLNEVAFSAFSHLRRNGNGDGDIGPAFLRSVQMIMLVGLPVFIGFAVTAEPLVLTVLGAKWAPTIPFVALLGLAMPFKTMLALFGPAANAIGRPDVPTKNSLAGALVMPAAFIIALQWGLIGIAYAWIAGFALVLLLAARWTLPVLGVHWREIGRVLAPAIGGTAAMAAIVLATDQLLSLDSPAARLAVLAGIGALTYGAFLLLFARKPLFEIVQLVLARQDKAATATS